MKHTNNALDLQQSATCMPLDAHYIFPDERLCLRPPTEEHKLHWAMKTKQKPILEWIEPLLIL